MHGKAEEESHSVVLWATTRYSGVAAWAALRQATSDARHWSLGISEGASQGQGDT